MHKQHRFRVTLLSVAILLLTCCQSQGKSTAAIRFDLGKNIADVAKNSGARSFALRDLDGFISYTLVGLQDKTAVLYDRPGFEIHWVPAFALTLYADHHRSSRDLVETVDVQLNNNAFNSLEASKAFVEDTIAQFQHGGWKRFIPESCPRVTGRSSLLNLQGDLDVQQGCPLDPSYKLSMDEWRRMMVTTQRYQWLGDGVLSELTFSYHLGEVGSPATFDVGLSFESKAAKDATDEKNLSDKLRQGDEKGWNSTSRYRAAMDRRAELNKLLEAAAEKRGDSVVPR
jgi:hypothetical protein